MALLSGAVSIVPLDATLATASAVVALTVADGPPANVNDCTYIALALLGRYRLLTADARQAEIARIGKGK